MRYNHEGVVSEISTLPGCSQVCVFHSVFIPVQHREKRLGTYAHGERLKEARKLGYQLAVCTIVVGNLAQEKILLHYGWKASNEYNSNKTGNIVQLWTKQL